MLQHSFSIPSLRPRLPKDFAFTGSPYSSKRSWINLIPFSSLNQIEGQVFQQKEFKVQVRPRLQVRLKRRRREAQREQVECEYLDERVTKDLNKKLVKLQRTMDQMQEIRMKKILDSGLRQFKIRRGEPRGLPSRCLFP